MPWMFSQNTVAGSGYSPGLVGIYSYSYRTDLAPLMGKTGIIRKILSFGRPQRDLPVPEHRSRNSPDLLNSGCPAAACREATCGGSHAGQSWFNGLIARAVAFLPSAGLRLFWSLCGVLIGFRRWL